MYYTTIECKRIWSLDKVLIPSRRTQAPRKHTHSTTTNEANRKQMGKNWDVFVHQTSSQLFVRLCLESERGKEKHNFDNCLFFPLPAAAGCSQDRPAGAALPLT